MEPADDRFSLSSVVCVKCANGTSHYVHVREITDDDTNETKKYFHVKKDKVSKLLAVTAREDLITNKKRPLTQTDVIEQVVAARDATFAKLVHNGPSAGTRIRYTKKDAQSKIAGLADSMVVNLPAIHNVPACDVLMLATKPGTEVWLELSEITLTYLSDAVAAQIENDMINRKRGARDVDVKSRSASVVPSEANSLLSSIDDECRLQAAGA